MEEKERFLNTIKEVNDDERILNDWVLEKLAEYKVKDQINYAMKEGIEKGIEQGIEKGIETKEVELIKNMLIKKYSYDDISEITGKTIEEIKEIEKSIEE